MLSSSSCIEHTVAQSEHYSWISKLRACTSHSLLLFALLFTTDTLCLSTCTLTVSLFTVAYVCCLHLEYIFILVYIYIYIFLSFSCSLIFPLNFYFYSGIMEREKRHFICAIYCVCTVHTFVNKDGLTI